MECQSERLGQKEVGAGFADSSLVELFAKQTSSVIYLRDFASTPKHHANHHLGPGVISPNLGLNWELPAPVP